MKINNFDNVFFSKLRLSIITHLYLQGMYFGELKERTGASDGNLSVQLSKLENIGYIVSRKETHKKKIRTEYSLTELGKESFLEYVGFLETVINSEERQFERRRCV